MRDNLRSKVLSLFSLSKERTRGDLIRSVSSYLQAKCQMVFVSNSEGITVTFGGNSGKIYSHERTNLSV